MTIQSPFRSISSRSSFSPFKRFFPYDFNAATYIDAVESADGQLLEPGVKDAINSFVLGCKNDGIWDAIKASCILAGARTLNGALVPLVGTAPTNNNFVAGDYDRETGLKGNGSTKYLNSNRNNNADPQNSNHNAVYVNTAGSNIYMGSPSASGGPNALAVSLTRNRNFAIGTGLSGTGFGGMSRDAASNYVVRSAGVSTVQSVSSTTAEAGNILVFCRGTVASLNAFTGARLAFYSIGESLDLALLDTRVTTLINAIGAAIQ